MIELRLRMCNVHLGICVLLESCVFGSYRGKFKPGFSLLVGC